MIKVEPCKGCGSVLLVDRFMGVVVRCDPSPLDAQAAGRALVAAVPLYRVSYLGGRPSSFGSASVDVLKALRTEPGERPMVVSAHRCTKAATENAHNRPQAAVQEWGGTGTPKAPQRPSQPLPVARMTPSLVPPSPVRVEGVGSHPSEGPRCSGCGEPCADGTYASIELGDVLVWAAHTERCGP